MNKPDARTLNLATQNYLRQQAIRLREEGKRIVDIAEYLGVHRNTVSDWWQQYQQEGEAALEQYPRGKKLGQGRTLNPDEEAYLQQLMRDYCPDELEIDSALWTRQAVASLVAQVCGVVMPLRSVGEYLKRWGMTPQKPLKRAYEQDPKAVEQWLETEYVQIQARAKQQGAEIAWGDEAGVRSGAQGGRGYAPRGETPEIRLNTQRANVNYIASIDNQGTVRFMLYTQTLSAQVFIAFLKRLIQKRQRKLLWIVDRHPVHRSGAVQQWLAEHEQAIELLYLPPYSPQLNPAEYLNCDVKQGVHAKPPTRNQAQLEQRVSSHLHKLQKLPGRIVRYFKHPAIAYAA